MIRFPHILTLTLLAFPGQSAKADERRAADVMAMDETKLLALVPRQCAGVAVACPKCKAHMTELGKRWTWRVSEPDRIECPVCGTVYPNDAYPMDRRATYLNLRGEKITLPCHEGPEPKGCRRDNRHPTRYHFHAETDSQKFRFTHRAIEDLARAYEATGRPEYARKALLLLYGYSKVYPHYLLHTGRGENNHYVGPRFPCLVGGRLRNQTTELPYGWTDGRLTSLWMGEIDRGMLSAYETVRNTPAAEALSEELGVDVVQAIDDRLIREMADFLMLVPWHQHLANNLAAYFGSVARAGRLIEEPELCHITYRYVNTVLTDYGREKFGVGYSYDLHNAEGTQGHYGVNDRIYRVFKSIEGYSDPPGFTSRLTGKRLDRVSLAKDVPLFDRSVYAPEVYALPSGRKNALHDTMAWQPAGTRACGMRFPPLEQSRCRALPGFGHLVLGDGRGEEQTQVQLHYSSDMANHPHHDCLSLTWFAQGKELSGEIGYQRNKLRAWSASTLAHNTVVVDRAEQPGSRDIGNLHFFIAGLAGLSAARVDGTFSYEQCGVTKYQRTVVLNTVDPARPYFIDVFEVAGGSVHDYTLHGCVDGDMTAQASHALRTRPGKMPLLEGGETWDDATGKGSLYGLFRNVRWAKPQEAAHVTFFYKDEPTTGSRIHFPTPDGATLYLAESPALRKAGHYRDEKVFNWWMPHLILRRRVPEGLTSVFVAVVDMFQGEPAVRSARRLRTGSNRAIGLKVELDGREDTVLFSLDGPRTMKTGDVETDGVLALVARSGGKRTAYLAGGTRLAAQGVELTCETGVYEGKLTDSQRIAGGDSSDAFVTGAALPEGEALEGSWLVLAHGGGRVTHGHQIDRIERRDGETFIHLAHGHGLRVFGGAATEVFSRWRTFQGGEAFTIHSAVSTAAVPRIELPPTGTGTVGAMRPSGRWAANGASPLDMQRFVPFMDELRVTVRAPEGKDVFYRLGEPGRYGDPVRYDGPVLLKRSATLEAAVHAPQEVLAPRFVSQRFQKALEPVASVEPQPGLRFQDYARDKPGEKGIVASLDIGGRDRRDFDGYLHAPRDGIYTFYLRAGRGALLCIGPWEVIDSRMFGPYREWSCRIALKAGWHPIHAECHGDRGEGLSVLWSGPGMDKQLLPPETLGH